jgi:hypothetical protein
MLLSIPDELNLHVTKLVTLRTKEPRRSAPIEGFKKIGGLFVPLLGNATFVRSVDDKGLEITINWVWEVREVCPPPI